MLVGSASHEQSSSSRHPSVTPFTPSLGSHSLGAGMVSPNRPLAMLNKDNPPEAALSKKLNALTSDLQRKEEQIASLTDEKGKAGTMKKQYDKLVADLLKQAESLKSKHSELHKKYEESNVCFLQPPGLLLCYLAFSGICGCALRLCLFLSVRIERECFLNRFSMPRLVMAAVGIDAVLVGAELTHCGQDQAE